MNMNKSAITEAIRRGKKRGNQQHYQTRIPGIATDRDRPKRAGHCGAENCSHASHRR